MNRPKPRRRRPFRHRRKGFRPIHRQSPEVEAVVGDVVRELTISLLSRDLTPEMEERLISAAEQVLETRLHDLRRLEESGESLVALSDYVQKKIGEDRGRGRFVQPAELETYLVDFFERNFNGTHLSWDIPAKGCLSLRLSHEAFGSLQDYPWAGASARRAPIRIRIPSPNSSLTGTFSPGLAARFGGETSTLCAISPRLSLSPGAYGAGSMSSPRWTDGLTKRSGRTRRSSGTPYGTQAAPPVSLESGGFSANPGSPPTKPPFS